jgi:hypothetical protein
VERGYRTAPPADASGVRRGEVTDVESAFLLSRATVPAARARVDASITKF